MPARFHFALAPLLERRRLVEEEQQHRCAVRQRERGTSLEEMKSVVGALRAWTVASCSTPAAYCADLDAAIEAQRERLVTAEASLQRARNDLIVARRERRAIETLRERRRRAFEQEEARREELDLDETNARNRRAAR
jgi:flagellar export protein FliJ